MTVEDELWNLVLRRQKELRAIRERLEEMNRSHHALQMPAAQFPRQIIYLLEDVRRMEEDADSAVNGEKLRWKHEHLAAGG